MTSPQHQSELRTTHSWTEYWAAANAGALVLDGTDSAGELVRDFWTSQRPLFSPSERVIDVGSGNAFLATVMYPDESSLRACPFWTCIDAAHVKLPSTHRHLSAKVSMLADRNFDQLLGAAHGTDWIVSNFGIEYTDLTNAALACRKNLKLGGQCLFLMHSAGSVLERQSRTELGDILFLTEQSDLFGAAAALLPLMAKAKQPGWMANDQANAARRRYNLAVELVKQQASLAANASLPLRQILVAIQSAFDKVTTSSTQSALNWVAEHQAAYASTAMRLQNMTQAALDARSVHELATSFRALGFDATSVEPLNSKWGQIGWLFRAS